MSSRSESEEINLGKAGTNLAFAFKNHLRREVVAPDPRFVTLSMKLTKRDDKMRPEKVKDVELETLNE